jgi:hypothetical protein
MEIIIMWRRLPAALSLFFLSPLIAEYLLGSLPISMIAILPLMAAMYGSGALLIREAVRRTGRGWPSLILLATAYGLVEEGLITQSLFNPNYLHLRLLDFGYVAWLGTGLPWLVYVISIHVVWSLSIPIGMSEVLFKNKRDQPWLGPVGIGVFALLFLAGSALIASYTYKSLPFMASPRQFAVTGAAVAALVIAAFLMPKTASPSDRHAPNPLILFGAAFGAGSALMLVEQLAAHGWHWPWPACLIAMLLIEAAFVAFMIVMTRGRRWSDAQRCGLMSGGLLVYVWVGFVTDKDLHGTADLPAHAVIACLFILLLGWTWTVALRPARTR